MNNNDVFKKLRVALMLRDDQIEEILKLVDFRMSKAEIGNFFRSADHPKFVECGDQVLRNFLNGLVIYLRGTKESPKDPRAVIALNKAAAQTNAEKPASEKKSFERKPYEKKPFEKKPYEKKPFEKKATDKKPYQTNKKPTIVEKVIFKNGKKK
jgi:hypothetical protein